MKQKIYLDTNQVLIATTLKDNNALDYNNIALHATNNQEAVILNRKSLANFLNIPFENMVFLNQTHSSHLYQIRKNDLGKGIISLKDAIDDCDACYTFEKKVPIGIFTADCVPIILYDPTTSCIAAIHSGWAGTVKEILNKVLDHLLTKEKIDPKNLIAYIGVAIEFDHFEVGMEVVEKFKQMSFDTSPFIRYSKNNKAYIDQKAVNKQMLLNHGVLASNIIVDPTSTMDNTSDDLFSYRKDKNCGRHFTYIMLR